jgi:hypothetical protein
MLERSKYFRDFFRRAKNQGEDEPFETFIFHWLAMIIGFTDLLSHNTYVNPKYKGDRDAIDDFLHVCEHVVESRLSHTILKDELEKSRVFMALRKGTQKGHFIVDGSGQPGVLLASCWGGNSSLNEFEQFRNFLYVACNIRNNLFHGSKSFMVESDVNLIRHMNLFLLAINEGLQDELH